MEFITYLGNIFKRQMIKELEMTSPSQRDDIHESEYSEPK